MDILLKIPSHENTNTHTVENTMQKTDCNREQQY